MWIDRIDVLQWLRTIDAEAQLIENGCRKHVALLERADRFVILNKVGKRRIKDRLIDHRGVLKVTNEACVSVGKVLIEPDHAEVLGGIARIDSSEDGGTGRLAGSREKKGTVGARKERQIRLDQRIDGEGRNARQNAVSSIVIGYRGHARNILELAQAFKTAEEECAVAEDR